MRRCGCNAIPLSGGLASAGGRLMAAGMFLLAFDLLRQRPATDAQKSAPPAKQSPFGVFAAERFFH